MSGSVRFTARERRRLGALKLRVERWEISEFDVVTEEGDWWCPVADPEVGAPNTWPGLPRDRERRR